MIASTVKEPKRTVADVRDSGLSIALHKRIC